MPNQTIAKIPKVIVLDFDGVVVESNDVKNEAFREVFLKYPKQVEAIFEFHLAHQALNRFEKFDYIHKNILTTENEEEKKVWARDFSDKTLDAVVTCSLVPGATEFLSHFSQASKLYLASMTPNDDLQAILKERELLQYFKKAYGAPLRKAEVLSEIRISEGVQHNEMVFIGDSPMDYRAAIEANVPFVGRYSGDELPQPTFKDLGEIKNYLLQRSSP